MEILLPIRYIFKSSIPKNQQVLLYVHCRASNAQCKVFIFIFPTDLKNEYLFFKVCKNLPFTSRRVTKKKFKIKMFWLDLDKGKQLKIVFTEYGPLESECCYCREGWSDFWEEKNWTHFMLCQIVIGHQFQNFTFKCLFLAWRMASEMGGSLK